MSSEKSTTNVENQDGSGDSGGLMETGKMEMGKKELGTLEMGEMKFGKNEVGHMDEGRVMEMGRKELGTLEMGTMQMGNLSKLEPMKDGLFEKDGIDNRPLKMHWEKEEEEK